MAFTNPYPQTFPFQQPYPYYGAYQQQPQQQPRAMTPPTIHADIIQVDSEAEADAYPMAAGSPPQMFMTKDESAVFIKTLLANNTHELTAYVKRPPKPAGGPAYVTWDELEKRLKTITENKRTERAEE